MRQVFVGLLLPFLGTALGAGCVVFLRGEMPQSLRRGLAGFAAGVMTAASVWSLLIPAMEESAHLGTLSFLPAAVGFWIGILFLLALDHLIPHLHAETGETEGPRCALPKSAMMVLAVILHNIPEGIAVGVVYAGVLAGEGGLSWASALALSLGIAIQNFPEGAIVSMPLEGEGVGKGKAFLWGVLSGAVEPLGALAAIALTGLLVPILPYLLGFAAGAMMYVVVEELIPEMSEGSHWNLGTICFSAGFTLMMALDVALG